MKFKDDSARPHSNIHTMEVRAKGLIACLVLLLKSVKPWFG